MSSSEENNIINQASSEELSVSAAAAESSLLNKSAVDKAKSVTKTVATSCACGVDVEGMKETRDDLIRKIKEVSSPKQNGSNDENDDLVPAVLSSLYSCAALDLDDEDDNEPLPVSFMIALI